MAGEKKIEQPEPVVAGLKSDICTPLIEQEAAANKDGVPSDTTSSLTYSGDTTSTVKGETGQQSVAEQGVYCPPTSCYYYYFPGYDGSYNQLGDDGYLNGTDTSYTGIQSDNGSLLYYLPGYNPYPTGTYMGVDGHPPYFSSSGYLQNPVSYASETMPCYFWNSTYVGNATNRTTAIRGRVKSALGSNVLVKMKGLVNPIKTNNTLNKPSNLPLNTKSRQYTASPNFSKSLLHAQSLKPLNQLGSGYQSAGPVKGFQTVGKFSTYTSCNQGRYFEYETSFNYKPNARMWNSNDRFNLRERNGEFEAMTELTRGPRGHNQNIPLNSSAEDERRGLSKQRDQYNLEDFQTEYDNAKFYVIKSFSEDDIHKCIKYDVWSSTPNGNKKLDAAFHDTIAKTSEAGTKCPIFLFYSVNGSGQFLGVAEMVGPVDFGKNMDFWQLDKWNGFFPVKWHIIKDIPNAQLRHITLENNDNKPVTFTRDTQEIGLEQGLEMLKIFKSYSGKTSMLDDFIFYENREKLLKTKRSSRPAPQTDTYKKHVVPLSFSNHQKAGERILGGSETNIDFSDSSSLINLTKNLSLGSTPLQGSAALN